MRTTNTTRRSSLRFLLLAGLSFAFVSPALAQPIERTPAEELAIKREESKMRDEIRRLTAEYSRFEEGATGFEGIWNLTGTRKLTKNGRVEEIAITGRVVFTRAEDGSFAIAGNAYLDGRTTGSFSAAGTPKDGKLKGTYKATIAGEGEATFKVEGNGLLMTLEGTAAGNAVTVDGEATHALTLTKAQLEAELYRWSQKLQDSRYTRPTPVRYRTPSRKTELRFTPSVEWDPNGVEQQVCDMIDSARRTIDMAVFEFSLMRVAKALVRAKERGIKIRMVYDNQEEEQPAIKHLVKNGLSIRSDARAAYMHNKFMVIDGRIVWTGSTNLAAGGIYVADNNAISFTHEPLAAEFTKEFEEMFVEGQFGPRSPRNTNEDWMLVDRGVKLQVRFAPEGKCMDRVVELVRGAKKSIRFIAFAYTSKALCDAMVERLGAGVTVEGIFEARHAGWADTKIGPLNAAGAKVRFDENPDALHHKVIVIDDRYALTGSFNFSDGADRSNDENLLVIDNRTIARAFVREFDALMALTDPTDPRIVTTGMGGGTSAPVDGLEGAVEGTVQPDR
jgi:phosphatidylserine/phosphatidylglycerophosphate/cardiolipin synthase-like enzyme